MSAKRVLLMCLGAVVISGLIGCAPTIVSSNAGVYQNGRLYAVADRNLDTVYTAVQEVMNKLQLQVTTSAKDVFSAVVVAKSADGKIISVQIKPIDQQRTKYSIHVGMFGNEDRSRKIFEEIEASLGTTRTK